MRSITVAALVLAALILAPRRVPAADSGVAGKAIYKERCATCHGDQGRGDGIAAAALTPRPRDFTSGKFAYGSSEAEVRKTITQGVPDTAMVGFQGLLSPEEITQVARYVRTLAAKRPRG